MGGKKHWYATPQAIPAPPKMSRDEKMAKDIDDLAEEKFQFRF